MRPNWPKLSGLAQNTCHSSSFKFWERVFTRRNLDMIRFISPDSEYSDQTVRMRRQYPLVFVGRTYHKGTTVW